MKSSAFLALSLILSACGELCAQDTSANVLPVTLGRSVAALDGWVPHPCDVHVFVASVG